MSLSRVGLISRINSLGLFMPGMADWGHLSLAPVCGLYGNTAGDDEPLLRPVFFPASSVLVLQ